MFYIIREQIPNKEVTYRITDSKNEDSVLLQLVMDRFISYYKPRNMEDTIEVLKELSIEKANNDKITKNFEFNTEFMEVTSIPVNDMLYYVLDYKDADIEFFVHDVYLSVLIDKAIKKFLELKHIKNL